MQDMGVKRPLEAEGFSEISLKQPKSIDHNEKLPLNIEEFTSQAISPQKTDSPGDKSHLNGGIENIDTDSLSPIVKELETSEEYVSGNSSEQEAENEEASSYHNFPPYIDFCIPWKPIVQLEDPYTLLLNASPRKEIPIGPNYQAEVPKFDSKPNGRELKELDHILVKEISTGPNHSSGRNDSDSENFSQGEEETTLVGTCVIRMPHFDDSDNNRLKVGSGRTECSCLDVGSTRCVQQHVKEAREKLRETLGEENFTKLGFCEMGEDVSIRWTADEEQMFHEVVYTNPASHGMNFWKTLRDVFPARSKKEIVSYYFNVFMLWKRAIQNRSYTLRIDSDDDEDPETARGNVHENKLVMDQETDGEEEFRRNAHHGLYTVGNGDSDDRCVLPTFKDHDLDAGWVDNFETEELLNVGDDAQKPSEHQNCMEKIIDRHTTTVGNGRYDDVDGERRRLGLGERIEKLPENLNLES